MFSGEFEYRVDEKGRAPLPPKYRLELRGGLVLTRGFEKCIRAYTLAAWDEYAKSVAASRLAPSKRRKLNRFIFGSAYTLTLDGQGRVALPVALKGYAEIEDEMVVVGSGDYFELWNRADWEAEYAADRDEAWQIEEALESN